MDNPNNTYHQGDEIEEIYLPDNDANTASDVPAVTDILPDTADNSENTQMPAEPLIKQSTENKIKSVKKAAEAKNTRNENRQTENIFYSIIADCGEFFCYVALKCIITPLKLLFLLLKFLWTHTALFRDAFSRMAQALWRSVSSPFFKTKRALDRTRKKIRTAKENGDRRTAVKLYLLIVKDAIFGKRGLAVTLFNYGAPIIALVFLMSVVGYATNTNYAIKLSVNGKFVGYIQNEQVFSDAERIMQERITYIGTEETISMTPEYSLEMLGSQDYLDKFTLANKMMEISDVSIEYAYGMYIGGKFYGALVDKEPVEQELERILDSYRTDSKDEDVAFEKDITYVPGLYLSDSIVSTDDIKKLVNSKKEEAAYYTVVDGDSHYGICEKLGMTLEELEELNPGINDEDYMLRAGDKLLKTQEVPFLSVSVSRTEVYEVDVPYDTEYTQDDEHYQGVNTTIQKGENGSNQITAKVYYVNGEEVKRTIVKTERVKDPVTEIISEGTLPPQSSHYSNATVDYDMKYIWPVADGRLGEWGWWDGGYYGHTGVDILADYGTDVYAGASGTVTFAGWDNGGYGYCVMILHPDGYTTLYGHNSEIFVQVGQKVTQGQCIAAVGQTGLAYGCHVHFEVRYGSERLNPRYYLSGLPSLY